MKRVRLPAVLSVALGCLPSAAQVASRPPAADKILELYDKLRAFENHTPGARPVSFQLSEADLNQYLKYSLAAAPRPGLESIAIKLYPHNYVSTFAVVDFDAVERWKPGAIPVLFRPMLKGKKSVWTDFRFQAQNRQGSFTVEKSHFQSVRLPAALVQKIIEVVAARQPEKYDASKPLPLPFGLNTVWTTERHLHGLQ